MYRLYLIYVIMSYSYVKCATILGVFHFPSLSHQVVYQPIWRELSLRGHKVTVVTTNPLNDPTLTNLTEINASSAYEVIENMKLQDAIPKDGSAVSNAINLKTFVNLVTENVLNNIQFQKLIKNQTKKFDLILIECYPVLFALGTRFKAPIICLSSLDVLVFFHDIFGNPKHPALFPDIALGTSSQDLTLWQRTESVLFTTFLRLYYRYLLLPEFDRIARKYFGEEIPYIGDLEKNISMLFLNVNPLIHSPRPTVPSVIELGPVHIKPVGPLPRDLKQILDEANEGVIYFSLGSNIKTVTVEENLRNNILGSLSELPYKVLMKWESDHLPGKPDNVIIRKWFPQQDLLAHPNVKVFITQGGLQSIEEAITAAVPMIGMPFFGDQPTNVDRIVKLGIGVQIDPDTVTKDEMIHALTEVAENTKYKKKIIEARDILYDKPMAGLEKAVWWCEYVIRHKGARHLRSPTADISWFQFLLLDVLSVIFLAMALFIYTLYKLSQLLQPTKKSSKSKSS